MEHSTPKAAEANKRLLANALMLREAEYSSALERIDHVVDDNPDARRAANTLREAIELVRCLRRLVPNVSLGEVYRAFGAPGDFGYETPIGNALSRLYRGDEDF